MSIDEQAVEKVARLSRIDLDASKKAGMAKELSHILDWAEQLSEVNTDDVEPMTSGVDNQKPHLRKDEVLIMNDIGAVLKNAPDSMQDFYTVPKVVE